MITDIETYPAEGGVWRKAKGFSRVGEGLRTEGSQGAICRIANRDAGYVSTLVKRAQGVVKLL